MSGTVGLSSHGSIFQVLEGGVYVPILGIDSLSPPDAAQVVKRVPDLSLGYKPVCAVGVMEGGQSQFSGHTDFISGNHDLLLDLVHNPEFQTVTPTDEFANFDELTTADRLRSWRITLNQFTPVKTWDYIGVLTKFTPAIAADELVKFSGTIEVSHSTALPAV